jgi:adenylate cyclase class 2
MVWMTRPAGDREIEIKLRLESARQGRALLRGAGFRLLTRRRHEYNIVFDTPGGRLRREGSLLRLRRAGRLATLTFKGPASRIGAYKSREELEVAVADFGAAEAILTRMGFRPAFRYEKFRTTFRSADGRGLAMLDETPIGDYLELEGEPRWIDAAAQGLGFGVTNYITDTYAGLYAFFRRRAGIASADMLFERKSGGSNPALPIRGVRSEKRGSDKQPLFFETPCAKVGSRPRLTSTLIRSV